MANEVKAYECETVILCTREPGDEDYDESPILHLEPGIVDDLFKKVTPEKDGGLGEPYCYLSKGTGLSRGTPIATLEEAEEALHEYLADRHDAEGNCIGDMLVS